MLFFFKTEVNMAVEKNRLIAFLNSIKLPKIMP